MAAVYLLRACVQGKLDVKASIYVSFEAKKYDLFTSEVMGWKSMVLENNGSSEFLG